MSEETSLMSGVCDCYWCELLTDSGDRVKVTCHLDAITEEAGQAVEHRFKGSGWWDGKQRSVEMVRAADGTFQTFVDGELAEKTAGCPR